MNLQCLVFCVLSSSILIVNGTPIAAGATLDEAKQAVDALQKTIQDQVDLAIPQIIEVATNNVTDVQLNFIHQAIYDAIQIENIYRDQVFDLKYNMTKLGYNVTECTDLSPISQEREWSIVAIRGCAFYKNTIANEGVIDCIIDMENALQEIKDISSKLEACGETQECIDQIVADVANATDILPKQIEQVLQQAEEAFNLLVKEYSKCSEEEFAELRNREAAVVVGIEDCVEEIVAANPITTTEATTTTEKNGSGASPTNTFFFLLPILLVLGGRWKASQ